MAHLLKAMVDKELVLNFILDCCFSVTVYCEDYTTIRFLPYDAEIDSKYPLSFGKSLGDKADRPANSDAFMLPNWLINSDGYAILVACDPHEFAKRITSDRQNHGALFYFLLKTFTGCAASGKNRGIFFFTFVLGTGNLNRNITPCFTGTRTKVSLATSIRGLT